MTITEALEQLTGAEAILLNRTFTDFNNALLMAIDALKEKQERENPEPLTIAELQQMDEEPIFVVPLFKTIIQPEWCVYEKLYETAYIPGGECWNWLLKDYGKTWIAYRYKPKEE